MTNVITLLRTFVFFSPYIFLFKYESHTTTDKIKIQMDETKIKGVETKIQNNKSLYTTQLK